MKNIFLLLLVITQFGYGQTNLLGKGDELINADKNEEAEILFKNGLLTEPNNLDYKCQLSLSLMNQKKHIEAEKYILEVLKNDSLNVGALWYGGINNFLNEKSSFRTAIMYFEKAFPFINKNSGQYFGINYFIGRSYKYLLNIDGISYSETSRMIETLKEYVRLQPNAEDAGEFSKFILYVEKNRPPSNVKKWLIAPNTESANEKIKEAIENKK